jgi:hypothetical protein
MPNSNHLTYDISNLVSLITKTKLGLSKPKFQNEGKFENSLNSKVVGLG